MAFCWYCYTLKIIFVEPQSNNSYFIIIFFAKGIVFFGFNNYLIVSCSLCYAFLLDQQIAAYELECCNKDSISYIIICLPQRISTINRRAN